MSSAEVMPDGEMVIRTLAMPSDTNPDGDIFGGWVLSQMDIAGGIFSKKRVAGRTVTVAVESMTFHLPVLVFGRLQSLLPKTQAPCVIQYP